MGSDRPDDGTCFGLCADVRRASDYLYHGRLQMGVVGNRIHLQRFISKNGAKVCTPAPGKLTDKDL